MVVYKENERITEDEELILRGCFNYSTPWHRDYCLKFIRNFKSLGIPMLLSIKENVRIIGSKLGVVNEVHFKKHNFASV